MKNIPKELRKKVKKYALMVAWWNIHEKDKDMQEKLVKVLEKIEDTEDELRISGIKAKTFDEILKKTKKFVKKSVGTMTASELETLRKLIFGQKTKWLPR